MTVVVIVTYYKNVNLSYWFFKSFFPLVKFKKLKKYLMLTNAWE